MPDELELEAMNAEQPAQETGALDEDLLDIAEIERRLMEEKPPSFVDADQTVTWHFPHDPEQWVRVRRLTAFEVREYTAIAAHTSATLQDPSRWSMEMRAADSYLYLLTRCIVEGTFKDKTGKFITVRQELGSDRQTILNEASLRKIYSRFDPLIASWLERKLLVFNDLTPARRR